MGLRQTDGAMQVLALGKGWRVLSAIACLQQSGGIARRAKIRSFASFSLACYRDNRGKKEPWRMGAGLRKLVLENNIKQRTMDLQRAPAIVNEA